MQNLKKLYNAYIRDLLNFYIFGEIVMKKILFVLLFWGVKSCASGRNNSQALSIFVSQKSPGAGQHFVLAGKSVLGNKLDLDSRLYFFMPEVEEIMGLNSESFENFGSPQKLDENLNNVLRAFKFFPLHLFKDEVQRKRCKGGKVQRKRRKGGCA